MGLWFLVGSVLVLVPAASAVGANAGVGDGLAERFRQLHRESVWGKADTIRLRFDAFHPQGLAIVGSRLFLSSVEVLNRSEQRGVGHLFELNHDGVLMRQITLGEGSCYHPGGIDYDGRWIWVPVAEYRPDSRTVVYRVSPETLAVERVFEWGDHLGALVFEAERRWLVAVSWGSRRYYRWQLDSTGERLMDADAPQSWDNGSHYVDYQDGQWLGDGPWALFAGIGRLTDNRSGTWILGGIELVDLAEMSAVHQVPVTLRTATGESMVRNPFAVVARDRGLRFYFLPEDGVGTLHVYDVE